MSHRWTCRKHIWIFTYRLGLVVELGTKGTRQRHLACIRCEAPLKAASSIVARAREERAFSTRGRGSVGGERVGIGGSQRGESQLLHASAQRVLKCHIYNCEDRSVPFQRDGRGARWCSTRPPYLVKATKGLPKKGSDTCRVGG